MRYAIISDIHANAVALRAVLADIQSRQADAVICLGDTVGYGPLPRQALQLVRQSCSAVLLGNHDWAVGERATPKDYVNLAGESLSRHREELSAHDREWLANLPRTVTFSNAAATHADFTSDTQFYYVETPEDAQANFTARREQLLFVGHTHTPALFLTGHSGAVYALPPDDFALEEGKRYLVNPGSVGYPREKDGKCFSSYVIYDDSAQAVYFRQIPFDVSSLIQRGKQKLPRHFRRALFGIGLLFLLLMGGAAAFWRPTPPPTAPVQAPQPPANPPVDVRTLNLVPGDVAVRANLKLDKNSPPVSLEIRFLSASGADVAPRQVISVKKSSMKAFKIPKDAAKAAFSIQKVNPDDIPRILRFAPTRTPSAAKSTPPR